MGIMSYRLKKVNKKKVDYYDLKSISQAYGSDGFQVRDIGVDMDNYVDDYPNFKSWITPTPSLEHEIKEHTHENIERLKQ